MERRRLSAREDERIARALRVGDPDGLRELHGAVGPMVHGYLRQVLHDAGAAEDVFQVVFAEAWRTAAGYDPARGSLTTWVMTIARSRAIDELRRRRPEPVEPGRLPDDPAEGEADRLAERWHVAGLLLALPDQERELLRLRFYEDLSQTEIAERTGLPLGTVKSRMVRGLERLHELLTAQRPLEHSPTARAEGRPA